MASQAAMLLREDVGRLRTERDNLQVWLSYACELLTTAVDSSGQCPGCLYHAGVHGEESDVRELCEVAGVARG